MANNPLQQDHSKRKARLTTEVQPSTMDRLKSFTTLLKSEGYDTSMASLVDRFLIEGMDRLMDQLGITQIDGGAKLKKLPPVKAD